MGHDELMAIPNDEDRQVAQVADRLLAVFPHHDPATIREIVNAVRHRFDDAPVRDFVPLLIERHAREQLAGLAEDAAISA